MKTTPPLSAVQDSTNLPKKTDIAIIGGGIAGICAAWELAKRGKRVTVLEKGIIGGEQSCRNWGWCRQQNRDERELPLSILALQIWDQLSKEIEDNLGFERSGIIFASDKEEDIAAWVDWAKMAKTYEVYTHTYSQKEIREQLPSNKGNWIGGVYSPSDGRADPSLAVPAIARAAQKIGVNIQQNCAVRALDFSGGEISGVVTEKGLVKCDKVLVAGGAWTGMFLRHHDVPFLQASIQSTSLTIEPDQFDLKPCVSMPDVALAKRASGGYTLGISGYGTLHFSMMGIRQVKPFWPTFVSRFKKMRYKLSQYSLSGPDSIQNWRDDQTSPFEKIRILNPAPDQKLIKTAFKNLDKVYPNLKKAPIKNSWGGFIDCTPDGIPVISEIKNKPGLFISSGYTAHGFGIGPAAGRLAADLICGDTPCVDPAPFRYERMIDGSDLGGMSLI